MKFRFEKYGVGFFVHITHDDGAEETYRTSKAADGLWKIDDDGNEKQIIGTCQFQAYQKTEAGQKAYIRKRLRDMLWPCSSRSTSGGCMEGQKQTQNKEDKTMANDNIKIKALLEERLEGYNVTFERILNKENADYHPCTIKVPAAMKPEVYENPYGAKMIQFAFPQGMAPIRWWEPADNRLPVESVKGKLYAYVDYAKFGDDMRRSGPMKRARFLVELEDT